MQHTSFTPDEELHSLVYEVFLCVNIYGSYKLLTSNPWVVKLSWLANAY